MDEENMDNVVAKEKNGKSFRVIVALIILINLSCVINSFTLVVIRSLLKNYNFSQSQPLPQPIAPLCLRCDDHHDEKEEDQALRRYRQDRGSDLCCPVNHQQLSTMVAKIYTTCWEELLNDKSNGLETDRRNPRFLDYSNIANGTSAIIWRTNSEKTFGHLTGLTWETDHSGDDDRLSKNPPQVVDDWYTRMIPYMTSARGQVKMLNWGLEVPVKGLYQLHSGLNFYFHQLQDVRTIDGEKTHEYVDVVHQISRFHAASGTSVVLAEKNQTIGRSYSDGLNSFVMTVAELEPNDVVYVSVSHVAALGMEARWQIEGLTLIY